MCSKTARSRSEQLTSPRKTATTKPSATHFDCLFWKPPSSWRHFTKISKRKIQHDEIISFAKNLKPHSNDVKKIRKKTRTAIWLRTCNATEELIDWLITLTDVYNATEELIDWLITLTDACNATEEFIAWLIDYTDRCMCCIICITTTSPEWLMNWLIKAKTQAITQSFGKSCMASTITFPWYFFPRNTTFGWKQGTDEENF